MKNILHKISIAGAVFAVFVAAAGCDKLLHQEPQGEWTEKDNTGGSYASVVFEMYAKVRGFGILSGNAAMAIHNLRCEDVDKGSTASDGSAFVTQFEQFQYSPSMPVQTYWTDNYSIVHIVNKLLSDIQTQEADGYTLSEGDLVNKAEAHFFRAYCYFNLVRAFGEVPLIDFAITDAAQTNVPKSTVDKIYALIDADLTEAEKYLPLKWTNYTGRLTQGAANALHAKAYLQRSDFGAAYGKANAVIVSGQYELYPNFGNIFREEGENCSESVLEWQCTATAELPGSSEIGSQFATVQGVRGAGDWNLGWGWFTPSQTLSNAFDIENDPRKNETLLYFQKMDGTPGDGVTTTANTPGGEMPIAGNDATNKWYNKKVYTSPALRRQFNVFGYWFNIRMIRYADVLLMAAEAANETGQTARSLELLEMVRKRARGGNSAALPEITTTNQVDLRAKIKHERRMELAMEWDRFYDLVRWGDAQSVLGGSGYQDKHKYLPLPQAEVDKSNGVLVQNPDY